MATGDILFLLLFVVLPTAIIVSGIWAVLFVRMRQSAGVRSVIADEVASATVTEAPALPPAIDATVTIAAITAGPTLSSAPEPAITHDAVALPTLSEREAIASIDLVAADLLFDQPQPPSTPIRMRDYTPTEEMPAISRAAEPTEATAVNSESDDVGTDAPEMPFTDDSALAEADGTPLQTDELRPESTEQAAADTADAGSDGPADRLAAHAVTGADTDEANPEDDAKEHDSADQIDDAAAADADIEGPQLRMRGPLRLIPSDDADPRDRRRARGAGRQVPQLGRSVRRQERRVER